MVHIWRYHRYLLGFSMIISFTFGLVLFILGLSRSELDILVRGLTKSHWVAAVRDNMNLRDNETLDFSRGVGISRIEFNHTPALKWPAIPTLRDRYGDIPFPWPRHIPTLLITLGIVSMIISPLGTYTTFSTRPKYVILTTILMLVMICSQFVFMFNIVAEDSRQHENLKNLLRDKVHSDYEIGSKAGNHFTYTLNSIMVSMECCGVTGPADFLTKNYSFAWSYVDSDLDTRKGETESGTGLDANDTSEIGEGERIGTNGSFNARGEGEWAEFSGGDGGLKGGKVSQQSQEERQTNRRPSPAIINTTPQQNFKTTGQGVEREKVFRRKVMFPLACCKNAIHMKGFEATLDCAASGDITRINNQGCRSVILEYFYAVHGELMMQVFFYVIVFELLQLIMITILASIPKDFEVEAAKLAIEYAESVELQAREAFEQAAMEDQEVMAAVEAMQITRASTKSTRISGIVAPRRPGTTTGTVGTTTATTSQGTGTTVAGIIRRQDVETSSKASSSSKSKPVPLGRRRSSEIW